MRDISSIFLLFSLVFCSLGFGMPIPPIQTNELQLRLPKTHFISSNLIPKPLALEAVAPEKTPTPPRPTPRRDALLLHGKLTPINSESLPFYTSYTLVMEEFRERGYPKTTLTIYPKLVCKNKKACKSITVPEPSVMELTYGEKDGCNVYVYEATSWYPDDIKSMVINDNLKTSCQHLANQPKLLVEITYSNGFKEVLQGSRIQ